MASKGRSTWGEKNANSKLTEEQVKEIKHGFVNGKTDIELSVQFNISRSTIYGIRNRRLWGYING
jgi:hypothetical protein